MYSNFNTFSKNIQIIYTLKYFFVKSATKCFAVFVQKVKKIYWQKNKSVKICQKFLFALEDTY